MIPALRHSQLLECLSTCEIEHFENLISKLGISESTLRRDLKELALNGDVEVLRGGAVRLRKSNIERGIDEKININREEKERIAKYAASVIKDNDVIFLDPSSLNYIMVAHIQAKNVKFVTNSIGIAKELVNRDLNVVLVGGEIKISTNSCVGPFAMDMLKNMRFEKCFIGANGLSVKMGITSHDGRERLIKQTVIENSKSTYFLIDSEKFNEIAMQKISNIDDHTVITGKFFPDYQGMENIIIV